MATPRRIGRARVSSGRAPAGWVTDKDMGPSGRAASWLRSWATEAGAAGGATGAREHVGPEHGRR